jgi:TonB-linked outer membrane protein, SusC/RagA family/TonB-dependent outer membrane receptor, SusC/RagA subfamily, signature region
MGVAFMLCLCVTPPAYAEDGRAHLSASQSQPARKISGMVTDNTGVPVVGANVVVEGTKNGVFTDVDGRFSLDVPENARLKVSFIGFNEIVVPVGDKSELTIVMTEDTESLDEVVFIGYGTVKKSDLTGSVATVSNKQFKDQPVKRVEDILQGRTPGVEVTTLSGMPGQGVKVRVRGTTSINKSSDPLYVVDGIVSSSGMEGLNPSDIQSIEVLKDASATAIYGSRGANGVVLITTKKGVQGLSQITFETSVGIHSLLKRYDLLNAYEYATALNDIWGTSTVSAADLEAYKNGTKGIDWQDTMTRTGVSQDYKLSASGGNKNIRYLVSGNVLDWSAIIINSNFKRYSFRTNLDADVKPWLNISANVNASRVHLHNIGGDLMNAINYSPAMEMKDEETGVYNMDPYNSVDPNSYGNKMVNVNDNYSYLLNSNLTMLFKILPGLTLSVQGGYNFAYNPSYSFTSSLYSPSQIPEAINSHGSTNYWQNTNNLTYQKSFGKHNLTATAVWEISNNKYDSLYGKGSGLANETVGYWNLANGSTLTAKNSYSEESMASGLGRVMYNYDNRYYVTATFRADGSSKFQGDNKWGYFPSASVAWDVANEPFMKSQDIFQQMKFRASYGVTGNQAIGRYSTLGMLSATEYGWGTSKAYAGYWGNTFATPDVSWEKTYQYDLGADFSVLNGRISFSLDWFMKQSKGLLFKKSVPMYNGGGSFWVNQGEVKNTGIELGITAYPLSDDSPVGWEIGFNASHIKNEIVDLAGQDFILDASFSNYGGAMQILKPGYPYGSFYLYQWEGFDDKGATLYRAADGSLTTSPTADDQIIKGQAEPKLTLGLNNMLSWKNWTLNVFINGSFGADRLNLARYALASMTGQYRFILLKDSYYQGWDKVENKADAKFPSHTNSDNKDYGNCTFWLEDASFIKLKNISLGYTLSKAITHSLDVQLSVSAQNVYTLTKYKGMDPETYNSYNGLDHGANPVPRTVSFGAKITF